MPDKSVRYEGGGRAEGKGKGKGKGKSRGKDKEQAKPTTYASDKPGYRWAPKSFRKKSLFAMQSFEDVASFSDLPGCARMSQLRTDSDMLGVLECIVVEPPAKQLVPQAFATSGVIICLHGMPPSQAVMEEWVTAASLACWAELSCTVVIPNVQMSAALQLRDFEAIVDAALELAGFSRCLIVGKAWGAHRAVEIASSGTIQGKVEGVILVAPSSPAPDLASDLACPVMMVWAADDEVSAFEESDAWMEALDDRCAPTTFLKCSSGGHSLSGMMKGKLEAQAVRNFTAAALLVGELEEVTGKPVLSDEETMGKAMSVRERRLTDEIPRFLQEEEESSEAEEEQKPERQISQVDNGKRRSSKQMDIMQWMQSGMTTAAE